MSIFHILLSFHRTVVSCSPKTMSQKAPGESCKKSAKKEGGGQN